MSTKRISGLLTTRVVLNILFWLAYYALDIAILSTEYNANPVLSDEGTGVVFGNISDLFFSLPTMYYFVPLWALMLLATVVYTNNLLLIPRLLRRKRYLAYIAAVVALTAATGFAATGFFNTVQYFLPGLPVYELVFSKAFMARQPYIPLHLALHYFQMTLVFTIFWHLYDYIAQRKKLEQAERKQAEVELNFLKNQINPHFLFNNLNNLYALAIKKSDNTPAAILQLSALLRYLLYDSNTPRVSFEKEKEIIAAYTELERLRLPADNNVQLVVKADDNYAIPPLLWLPVLENMFKHGIHTMHGGGYGEFIFSISNNWLQLYSRNRIDPTHQHKDAGGIGFVNLEKRLQLLYEGKHRFVRRVENDHYIVDLSIDLS